MDTVTTTLISVALILTTLTWVVKKILNAWSDDLEQALALCAKQRELVENYSIYNEGLCILIEDVGRSLARDDLEAAKQAYMFHIADQKRRAMERVQKILD